MKAIGAITAVIIIAGVAGGLLALWGGNAAQRAGGQAGTAGTPAVVAVSSAAHAGTGEPGHWQYASPGATSVYYADPAGASPSASPMP